MKYKTIADGNKYKHKIEVYLKQKERVIYLYTNDDNFNISNNFTCRRSLDIPTNIEGFAEDYCDSSGGVWDNWKHISDNFGTINSQGIIDIVIDDVSINKEYEYIAKKFNFTMKFPLLYHFQVFKENSNKVLNWYPTTGATTIQNKDEKYSTQSVGYFIDFEKVLTFFKDYESLPTPNKHN